MPPLSSLSTPPHLIPASGPSLYTPSSRKSSLTLWSRSSALLLYSKSPSHLLLRFSVHFLVSLLNSHKIRPISGSPAATPEPSTEPGIQEAPKKCFLDKGCVECHLQGLSWDIQSGVSEALIHGVALGLTSLPAPPHQPQFPQPPQSLAALLLSSNDPLLSPGHLGLPPMGQMTGR